MLGNPIAAKPEAEFSARILTSATTKDASLVRNDFLAMNRTIGNQDEPWRSHHWNKVEKTAGEPGRKDNEDLREWEEI